MKVLIVGCGRLGSRLARDFAARGQSVSVVDSQPEAFTRLPDDFPGQVVLGTGIDEDVLKSAGIETADAFVAVTDDDNTNIMAAQIARTLYRVPQVIVRIYDPERAEVYRGLGLNVLCPTISVADWVEEQISHPTASRARS